MKKRLSIFLCALLCILTLAGCGAVKEEPDYSNMEETVSMMLTLCAPADQSYVEALQDIREQELDHALIESSIPCNAATYIDVIQSWVKAQDEMGALLNMGEFEYSEENGQINATTTVVYEQRDAEMTFSFKEDGTLKGLSIGAFYSTSEILYKAAMNTLIGMGSVFGVLIFIAIIIAIMGKVLTSAEGGKKKKAAAAAPAPAPAAAPAAPVDEVDDLELVAVISAAIAASTGASTDSFVVRSIKRRSRNSGWNRA